jgi:hypothetical protein
MVLHSLHNFFHSRVRYIPQDFQQVAARSDLTGKNQFEASIETARSLG